MCKQKIRGMIYQLVEITSFMGAALVEVSSTNCLFIDLLTRVYTITLQNTILYSLYAFGNYSSST